LLIIQQIYQNCLLMNFPYAEPLTKNKTADSLKIKGEIGCFVFEFP